MKIVQFNTYFLSKRVIYHQAVSLNTSIVTMWAISNIIAMLNL